MTFPAAGRTRRALASIDLITLVRRQTWLLLLYRCLPDAARRRLRARLSNWFAKRLSFERTSAWTQNPPNDAQPYPRVSGLASGVSVNVLGYLKGQFGLAESARRYAGALLEHGARVALCDVDLSLDHDWNDVSLDPLLGAVAPYGTSILFINPDYLGVALAELGQQKLEGRRRVACWYWELERVPSSWLPYFEQVDEFIVASAFIEEAFRRVTDKPITRIPLPVACLSDSGLQRRDFGLPDGEFIVLVSFDFNSSIARKNPQAAIESFQRAFPGGRSGVRMLIKTSNGFRYPDRLQELLQRVSGDARIMVRDDIIEGRHVRALQRCCDAYISLHRAEGFGLVLAECMLAGKPVIATGWSGNMEFMNADNSCLVSYRLVPIEPGEYPDGEGQRWAEPDVDVAARHLRRLAEDPHFASRLGEAARVSVQQRLSTEQAARQMAERFGEGASCGTMPFGGAP